jgi:hypothetical protein
MCRNYFPFILLVFLTFGITSLAQSPVSQSVDEALAQYPFDTLTLFQEEASSIKEDMRTAGELYAGSLLQWDEQKVEAVLSERPKHLLLSIPRFEDEPLELELILADPLVKGFVAFTASDRDRPLDVELGRHYQGRIKGQPGSLVALSVTRDEIMATIGAEEGTYVLGKIKGDPEKTHVLYREKDVKETPMLECHADDLPENQQKNQEGVIIQESSSTTNCVNVYVEVDHDIFLEKGTVQACMSFVTSFFHQVYILYANDGIDIALQEVLVWDVPSPYTGPNSGDYLDQFVDETGTNFPGDIAHLISYGASGGIAYVDVLCFPFFGKAFSSINTNFAYVPDYSWTIEVFAHEMGHNCGSRHTHACVWNGNNTPIDCCGYEAGFPENSCGNNYNCDIPLPDAGTIMSYCHLVGGVGIDFNEGFHPQVASLIQSEVNNGFCLGACTPLSDTFYCYSHGNSVSDEWISNVTLGSFSNSSGADNYSDFTNLTINADVGATYPISITPAFSGSLYNEYFRVWMDFNKDFDFNDPGELVFEAGPSTTTVNGNITIPPGAIPGKTRMRVSMKYNALPDTCEMFAFGEVEDYTLEILSSGCANGDSEPPEALCQDISICLEPSTTSIVPGDIDAGSNDNCLLDTLYLSEYDFSCEDVGDNLIILTAQDTAGNTATCSATVVVQDCDEPEVSCQDLSICLDVNGTANLEPADVEVSSSDNCGIIQKSLSATSFGCNDIGENAVTLSVFDGSGGSGQCTATVTVEDCTAPTASCQDISVCLDTNGNAVVDASEIDNGSTDNCGSPGLQVSPSSFTCDELGSNPITLTVTDASGNSDECTATVTVEDCAAPTASCQDISVCLDANGNAVVDASEIDNGSTDNCGSPGLQVSPSSFTCNELGGNTITLIVTDVSGNSDQCTAIVTVEDCAAPTASCQDISVCLDANGNAVVDASEIDNGSTDNCGSPGLQVSPSSFTCDELGSNPITLTVTDASGNSDQCTATVTVEDCAAPTASCQDISVCLDANGNAVVDASEIDNGSTDNCGSPGLQVSPSSFTCDELGSNPITLTVTDASGNSDQCTAAVTVEDCAAPTASCQDISVCLDANGNAVVDASEIDNGSTDNCGSPGLQVSPSSFTCDELGSNAITLTVTDASGNSDQCTAFVIVEDCAATTASCQDITVCLGGNGSVTVAPEEVDNSSSDNCGIVSSTLTPNTFSSSDLGVNTVLLNVQDASGNSDECTATVTVEDCQGPNAVCQDISVCLDGNGQVSITAAQVDNGSNDSEGIDTLLLNQYEFSCFDIGDNTVILTAIDLGGNSSSCTATVEVEDCDRPEVFCQDITVCLDGNGNVSVDPSQLDAGSMDNCGAPTLQLSSSSFSCNDLGDNAVTLTATDAFGNSDECTATVEVEDCAAPVVSCQDVTVCLDGNGEVSVDPSLVDNGSTDNCGALSLQLSPSSFGCMDIGGNVVTLTATDASGNSDECTATVTVEDCAAPIASCQDLTVCLDANGDALVNASEIDNGTTDNCDSLNLQLSLSSFSCADLGNNTITLTATDAAGNSEQCTAMVTVEDCTAPNASCQDISVCLGQNGSVTVTPGEVDNGSSDNCGIVSSSLTPNTFSSADIGDNAVVLNVQDAAGNSAECSAVVTVEDCQGPNAVCQDITVCLDSNGQLNITADQLDGGSNDSEGIDTLLLDKYDFLCSDIGDNTITLTAVDVGGNTGTCTATVSVEDCTAPLASCQDISVCLDGNGSISISPAQVDNGSGDNCSISILELDETGFSCGDIGTHTVTLSLTDPSGNSSQCNAMVTVQDCDAPEAICQDISLCLDSSGEADLLPAQIDGGSTDNCEIDQLFAEPAFFTDNDLGIQTVTLIVVDEAGNSDSCFSNVEVLDCTAPEAICQDITVCLDDNGEVEISPDQVNQNNSPEIDSAWLSQDLFSCDELGDNIVTLTVQDAAGNTSSCISTISIQDCSLPELECQDISICLDQAGMVSISASQLDAGTSDNCEIDTLLLTQYDFDCGDLGTNTVKLTAVDIQGNAAACNALVTVEDCDAPIAVCQDISVCLDANGEINLSGNEVDNGSTDNCNIASFSLDQAFFNCEDISSHPVSMTISDEAGNSDQCAATVTVEDCSAPEALCQDVTVSLDANGQVSPAPALLDGGSSDNCGIALFLVSTSNFDCEDLGPNSVTFYAFDGSGLQDNCNATITVVDDMGPELDCPPNLSIELGTGECEIPVDFSLTATDNCALSGITLTHESGSIFEIGTTTVGVTALDDSGNSSSCSFEVIVNEYVAETDPSCVPSVVLPLDAHCETSATLADFLQGEGGCEEDYIFSISLDGAPLDPFSLNADYLGEVLDVVVTDTTSGNNCTTTLELEDPSGECSPICPDSIVVNDQPIPSGSYQAASYLSSAGTVSSFDTVYFSAGMEITLLPGFYATDSSYFHAYIDSCQEQNSLLLPEEEGVWTNARVTLEKEEEGSGLTLKVFPNPFRASTTVQFNLPEDAEAGALFLGDATGQLLQPILSEQALKAGSYEFMLDGANLQPGLYILILKVDGKVVTEKVVLIN